MSDATTLQKEKEIIPAHVGIILDGRGRPFDLSKATCRGIRRGWYPFHLWYFKAFHRWGIPHIISTRNDGHSGQFDGLTAGLLRGLAVRAYFWKNRCGLYPKAGAYVTYLRMQCNLLRQVVDIAHLLWNKIHLIIVYVYYSAVPLIMFSYIASKCVI